MPSPARLTLRILDHEPPTASPHGSLTRQVWKGGATDLSTRSVIADPPRWLELADHGDSLPPSAAANTLPSWDLRQIQPGHALSVTNAGGVILVSMDIDPDREAEFNDWYNTEHIPRLSAIPGVLAARRFHAIEGTKPGAPAYVALYHVRNTDIYATRTWMAANETPWMLRMRRFQRNRTYFTFPTRVG
jgi:hypothetical protein